MSDLRRQACAFADRWDLEGAITESGPLIDELTALLEDAFEAGQSTGRAEMRQKPTNHPGPCGPETERAR